MKVPATVEEITPSWLSHVLGHSADQPDIQNLTINRIGENFGFASQIYLLKWQAHGAPQSAVAKLWDTEKAGGKEVLFFKKFKPLDRELPQCLYAAADRSTKRGVLLLEDLSSLEQGDVLQQLTLSQSIKVAQRLAKIHATYLNSALLKESWIVTWEETMPSAEWIESRRKIFLARFPNKVHGAALTLLNNLDQAASMAHKRLRNSAPTLLHGDFHLDNVLFEQAGAPVFLDWSRPMLGPAVVNLAPLIFEMSSLDHFDQIIDSYLKTFNAIGFPKLEKKDLIDQLRFALIFQFMQSTCGIAKWQPKIERGRKIIEVNIHRANGAGSFWQKREPQFFSFLFSEK